MLLSNRMVAGIGILAATMLLWAGAATWYIASSDELTERVFVWQTEMKARYEDRIAHLSTNLEREVTQNLVERRSFDARIGAVATRQGEIEARQAWLRNAAEQAGLAPGNTPRTWAAEARVASRPPAASPTDTKPAPLSDGSFRLRDTELEAPRALQPRDRLSALENKLDSAATEEIDLTKTVGRAARVRLTQIRAALDTTGIDIGLSAGSERGTGGPLVPLDVKPGAGPVGFLLADLGSSLAEIRRLDALARSLPLGAPVTGEAEQTSGFGTRYDPFTRAPALHTGLDFRAETGTPARATGSGRVLAAEYSGGYGNMVEIDHGNGIVTRYGHLMSFAVAAGQRSEAGQIVGLTGSTGRSTGPHLHYETRIGGEPVNPVRFLESGRLLGRQNG